MNKDDLLTLLTSCDQASPLLPIAVQAANKVRTTDEVRIALGDPIPCEELLRTYEQRLERKRRRGQVILGLEETVISFQRCSGVIGGGYAELDGSYLYFWVDQSGKLVGCLP